MKPWPLMALITLAVPLRAVTGPAAPEVSLILQGADHARVALPLSGETQGEGGTLWATKSTVIPVPGRDGCVDYVVEVTLLRGRDTPASVSLVATVENWSSRSYVLAPSIVYDGNRFDVVDVPYSPFWPDSRPFRLDNPTSFTVQPRLNKDGAPAAIELDAGNMATPCLGFRDPSGAAFLMLAPQANELGNYGFTVEEDGPARIARFLMTTPRSRSRAAKMIGFAPGDPTHTWTAGEHATLRARLWRFKAPVLQGLFDRFAQGRKDFSRSTFANELPFSAASDMVRRKLNDLNWDEGRGYYRHGINPRSTFPLDYWQLGWVSGGITTLPMLSSADPVAQAHAWRNLSFLFTESPCGNGLFRAIQDQNRWQNDDPRPPHPGYQLSVRRECDALYYGLKQLMILRSRGTAYPPEWDQATRGLADALVRVFHKNGQLGQYLDIRTGDILIGGSTAGALLPAALILASRHFGYAPYLQEAQAIGEHFVRQAVDKGLTTGGPCDALTAPDSESSFAMVQSLTALHEATGEPRWAQADHAMIRQFSTWVTSYDYAFPAGSPMAGISCHSTGAVWANVQNKHAAPAICNFSGDALLRYWRATGDRFALELLQDIARHMPQYVSRPDRPLSALSPGMMCERVNLSDWEGQENVGGHIYGSCIWVETALLLTTLEVPGIYARVDTGEVIVFDQLEARREVRPGGAVLVIRNPTRFEARTNVLMEDAQSVTKPLPLETLATARSVIIAPGAEVSVPLQASTAR